MLVDRSRNLLGNQRVSLSRGASRWMDGWDAWDVPLAMAASTDADGCGDWEPPPPPSGSF